MPWVVCVKSITKNDLYYTGRPCETIHIRRDVTKKLWWSKDLYLAKTYPSRRKAARDAGLFKKNGGAIAFYVDDVKYTSMVMTRIHS